jgi:hypothetical protein
METLNHSITERDACLPSLKPAESTVNVNGNATFLRSGTGLRISSAHYFTAVGENP